MKTFRYEISGTAPSDQTWKTSGTVNVERSENAYNTAMGDAFLQLTQGKAIYGLPGVLCHGPYELSRILIERADA